jgi:hypothetical protein
MIRTLGGSLRPSSSEPAGLSDRLASHLARDSGATFALRSARLEEKDRARTLILPECEAIVLGSLRLLVMIVEAAVL